ncbi:hypothetical protein AAFF_G00053150 [Aldrovandia affinis]|uniref:Granulins domain-containing protein n=1 Tax=Aldrovandia affinis TaxID=143900 RepID=A0AAD7T557_9TELE|nr:hypothetical protein AAFF_G00053150 [Aldrovandia affinis]
MCSSEIQDKQTFANQRKNTEHISTFAIFFKFILFTPIMLHAGVLCALLALTSALTCPDARVCKDGYTCCQTPSNEYGCCPIPNAECCEDHLHCCYEGMICDMENAKCLNKTSCLPWLERVPATLPKLPQSVGSFPTIHAVPVNVDYNHICPDETRCPMEFSCLRTHDGKYSCCPFPRGVSCLDGSHCCPNEYQCSKDGTSCTRKTEHVEAIICPDGESECPDETTCCQLLDGSWGCCPMAKAVCCKDRMHCCPEGTTCDIEHSKCLSPTQKDMPMWERFPARKRQAWEDQKASGNVTVTCPGGKSKCPDHTTCCELTSGLYGCCPYPNAVCCSDHLHCCPDSTTCDLEHKTCKSSKVKSPPGDHVPSPPHVVECSDKVSTCPDDTTCCKLTNGNYSCCPMPRAVCCEDHLHCCPEDTECDLAHSTCVSTSGNTTWATKLPAVRFPPSESTGNAVRCNDSVACSDGDTCCRDAQGQWACCPLPQAVCCEDDVHCCPHDTVCNLAASTCDDPTGSVPWLEKVPAVSLQPDGETNGEQHTEAKNVTCDSTHTCPSGSTCCQTEEGEWACCPLLQAVCCEDHLHCCPRGTVCNVTTSTCDDHTGSVPWLEKAPALTLSPNNEKCDEQTVCPSGTTCCKQNSGQWACCPLPHAVCCEDHEHCCPKGYKCDVSQQACNKPGELGLPWVSKQPALGEEQTGHNTSSTQLDTRLCDPQTICPRDTTCCYMNKTRKWGCCPLPNAVCCDDGDHCCPNGYKCNVRHTSCTRGSLVIPWYRKEEARGVPTSPLDVKCDTQKSCAAGMTCCQLPTGQWGCCPLLKAICCSDNEHCCPQGYVCNIKPGTCERRMVGWVIHSIPLFQVSAMEQEPSPEPRPEPSPEPRQEASPEPRQESTPKGDKLECGGQYRCPDSETCCRTSATTWACCPSPKAVCCFDMKHCCPAGYSCDAVDGSCTEDGNFNWNFFFGDGKRAFIPV